MMLSEDKQSHLAHLIIDGLWKDELVNYSDEGLALRKVKEAISEWVQQEDNIEVIVRKKIGSLKRALVEGSSEWEIMYRKYYEEEMNKRG